MIVRILWKGLQGLMVCTFVHAEVHCGVLQTSIHVETSSFRLRGLYVDQVFAYIRNLQSVWCQYYVSGVDQACENGTFRE